MPLQLYEKEQILDACLAVFARYGYEKTTTAMLAEAAGVSKALIFHHFKNKRNLYISILDQCLEKMMDHLHMDDLTQYKDFFAAVNQLSRIKLDYFKKHPKEYTFLMEVFYKTPDTLKPVIQKKMGAQLNFRHLILERLFSQVPLREGVDRQQAFQLIEITLKYLENKLLTEATDETELDEKYLECVIDEMNRFMDMIRHGIER